MDRLSSLISHFEVRASIPTHTLAPNLWIIKNGEHTEIVLLLKADDRPSDFGKATTKLHLDFGGQANPVIEALPSIIRQSVTELPDLAAIVQLLVSETDFKRCGGQFAIDRLCEVLLVSVLRRQIEINASDSGMLAALADPNLSPVLVAIHDRPGESWRLDDLVELSGMSRSQFMNTFQTITGLSPMAYLKHWRMTLARNAILNGQRVKETARQFGYGSGDAFTRAFTATYGVAPTQLTP